MLTDFKAQAEALIKFANHRDGLLTCALRSSIVFGPGDTEFVPFIVNLAKSRYAKVLLLFHPVISLIFLIYLRGDGIFLELDAFLVFFLFGE